MAGTRSRWSLLLAAVIVAVVVAIVAVFGVIPLPDPPLLADRPSPEITADLAYVTGAQEPCLWVADGSGESRELGCGSRFEAFDIRWVSADTLELDGGFGDQTLTIDAATGAQIGVRPRPEPTAGPQPSPSDRNADGSTLQTGDDDGAAWIDVIDDDGVAERIIALEGPRTYRLLDPRWSEDGRWIVVRDSVDRILVLDVMGRIEPRVWANDATAFAVR